MRAAVFVGPGRPLRVEHRPVPWAEPGEVVLRVAFCGICGRLVARISGVDVLSPIASGVTRCGRTPGVRG
jgi:D-arabinose 1-dehydrogenase-like Zn-dependent alcohol dehydrogenase